MRLYKKLIVLLPFLFLLLTTTGALGLKSLQNCTDLSSFADKIHCYHEAAISYAYVHASIDAENACDKIGQEDYRGDNDLKARGEVEANACYYDIAKIIARYKPDEAGDLCTKIDQSDYGTVLKGAQVTKEICDETVKRITKPRDPANSLCNIMFVLPFLVFIAFLKK